MPYVLDNYGEPLFLPDVDPFVAQIAVANQLATANQVMANQIAVNQMALGQLNPDFSNGPLPGQLDPDTAEALNSGVLTSVKRNSVATTPVSGTTGMNTVAVGQPITAEIKSGNLDDRRQTVRYLMKCEM